MQSKKWVYRVSHSRSHSPFLTARAGFFLRLPSPGSLAQTGFILSYASVLFRALPSSVRPGSKDPERLPWGSRSLFATSTIRVQAPSHPICSLPFRPRRFSRPRRFTPRLALWVYFTPLPRPGFTLQGFPLRPQPRRAFAQPLPSRRCPNSAKGSCPPSPLRSSSPSGLSSASESGAHQQGISLLASPNPLLSFPPSGFPAVCSSDAFTPPAAHDLQKKPSQSFSSWPSACFRTFSLACLSRDCRPARGF